MCQLDQYLEAAPASSTLDAKTRKYLVLVASHDVLVTSQCES